MKCDINKIYCELKQWCGLDIVMGYMQLYESSVFKEMNYIMNQICYE